MNDALPKEIVWRTDKVGYEPPQQKWLENNRLQELVMESRKKLVSEKIITDKILQQPVQIKSAYEINNFDWRYLTAAQFF